MREKATDEIVGGSSRPAAGSVSAARAAVRARLRERRPQRDVGHDRQRVGEARDRHVQPHGRRVDALAAPRSAPR
jgi:hypothetical protein